MPPKSPTIAESVPEVGTSYSVIDSEFNGARTPYKDFFGTGSNLLTRVEFRQDRSNQPFFPKSDPTVFAKTQATVLAGLVWTFSTREQ